MKILRIKWQNFKGLQDGEINANGNDVFITGRNGSGKTSIAEVLPFVLFGKITGSVKTYENGIAPTDDGLIHAAEIIFDTGDTLRREVFWKGNCNSATLYINGNKVSLAEFNSRVRALTNDGGFPLFNPFAFCELPPKEQRNFLLTKFDTDIFNLPEFKDAEEIFGDLSADLFKERAKLELKRAKTVAENIPHRINELIKQRANLPADLTAEQSRLADEITKTQAALDSLAQNKSNLPAELSALNRQINATKNIKDRLDRQLLSAKSSREALLRQYHDVVKAPNGKCPTCGQLMPQQLFVTKRNNKLAAIKADGLTVKNEIITLTKDLESVTKELESLDKQANQIAAQIQAQAETDNKRNEKISQLKNTLAELNYQLANVKQATENQSRIDDLTKRGKELGKRITELEGHIQLADTYQQRKIERA